MSAFVRRRGLAALTAVALAIEALLAALAPGSLAGAPGEVVALAWLALLASHLVAGLRRASSARTERGAESRPGVSEPLERLRRNVELGTRHAGDFHLQLRPTLRGLATERLRRHDVDLERDADSARTLLGDEGYALVRPDRAPPEDRFGLGPSLAAIDRLAGRLEEL